MCVNADSTTLVCNKLTLGGLILPIVSEYKYLGLMFCSSLSASTTISYRRLSGSKLLSSLYPFLSNSSSPFCMKLDLIRNILLPVLSFGCEFFGMYPSLSAPLDKLLKKAITLSLRGWGPTSSCLPVLCSELNLFSVEDCGVAARVRAYRKYRICKTFMRFLIREPFVSRSLTWVSKSIRYINQTGIKKESPKTIKLEYQSQSLAEFASNNYTSALWYSSSAFLHSRNYIKSFVKYCCSDSSCASLEPGLVGLILARCGGLSLGHHFARMCAIPEKFLETCPCCEAPVRESLYHLFFVCSAWSSFRSRFLAPIIRLLPFDLVPTERVMVLLGGKLSSQFSLGKRWYSFNKKSKKDPMFILVTRFLAGIRGPRLRLLRRWSGQTLSQGPTG